MVGGLSVRRRSRDVSGSQGSGRTSLALLFFFFSVLGFELRALCLLIVLLFFSTATHSHENYGINPF
jgi:hypothetical protein